MSYRALFDREAEEDRDEINNPAVGDTYNVLQTYITQGQCIKISVSALLSMLFVLTLCVLVVVNLAKGRECHLHKEGAQVVLREYGRDTRFQSLDHQYDHNWPELNGNFAVITLPPDGESSPNYGSISMLVFLPKLHFGM